MIAETMLTDGMLPPEVYGPVRKWLDETSAQQERRVAVLTQTMSGVLDTFRDPGARRWPRRSRPSSPCAPTWPRTVASCYARRARRVRRGRRGTARCCAARSWPAGRTSPAPGTCCACSRCAAAGRPADRPAQAADSRPGPGAQGRGAARAWRRWSPRWPTGPPRTPWATGSSTSRAPPWSASSPPRRARPPRRMSRSTWPDGLHPGRPRRRRGPGSPGRPAAAALARSSPDLATRSARAVSAWQDHVMQLVQAENVTKRSVARVVSFDEESLALVLDHRHARLRGAGAAWREQPTGTERRCRSACSPRCSAPGRCGTSARGPGRTCTSGSACCSTKRCSVSARSSTPRVLPTRPRRGRAARGRGHA